MEKIRFIYALKNIPIPSKTFYQLTLLDKIENVIKQMRWKTNFFINRSNKTNFKEKHLVLRQKTPHHQVMICKTLKKELFDIVKFNKYKKRTDR